MYYNKEVFVQNAALEVMERLDLKEKIINPESLKEEWLVLSN